MSVRSANLWRGCAIAERFRSDSNPLINIKPKGKRTMKLQEAIKGMAVKSWERRENSDGKCKVYVRFAPKKPVETVDVKEAE